MNNDGPHFELIIGGGEYESGGSQRGVIRGEDPLTVGPWRRLDRVSQFAVELQEQIRALLSPASAEELIDRAKEATRRYIDEMERE